MSISARTALQLTLLCLVLSAFSFASGNASLYIVQGITGRNLASTDNPDLPLDILLNGESCVLHGLDFGATNGPLTLAAGNYDVKVSPANTLAPCTNAPLADTTVALSAGDAMTVVATLDSSGAATLLTFPDNLDSVASGNSRFVFAQAADAPAVQVTLTELNVKNPVKRTFTVNPGAQNAETLPVATYSITATASGTTLFSGVVIAENQTLELSYLVGETSNNSISLITRLIREVF